MDGAWPPVLLAAAVLVGLLAVGIHEPGPTHPYSTGESPILPRRVITPAGELDVEDEYLPGVVDCEIAPFTGEEAALEAQAIAARTFLARHVADHGPAALVPLGPEFQCWRPAVHRRARNAVHRTRGLVVFLPGAGASSRGPVTSGHFVAGARPDPATCLAGPPRAHGYPFRTWGDLRARWRDGRRFPGAAWTEAFVTRQESQPGGPRPTALGAMVPWNRGALGQHAAICLARRGLGAAEIVRAFYGADVVIAL